MFFRREAIVPALALFGRNREIIRLVAAAEGLGDCDAWLDPREPAHIGAIRYENKLYIAGNIYGHDDDGLLREFLRVTVAERRLDGHALDGIKIRTFDERFEKAVLQILKGWDTRRAAREYLEVALPARDAGHMLPAGYSFRDIDEALIMAEGVENIDLLRSECAYRYDCTGHKETDYLGLAAMYGDSVAGWCLSEYMCSAGCEIGIEVVEGHQRKGLATAMTDEFLKKAHVKGIKKVGWHCYQSNVPSLKTAIACGFERVVTYQEAYITFPPSHLGSIPPAEP
ncbi:MAG TPA: GNAT family N-acetyltransferase [Bacillota bacterium]|nr:GNAT family N-acetyltransferase [Bacillota bacterium]HOA15260.1 GNAT family N-acetyltransferase [Bacillota bacterium]HOG53086.1 GNAT family N-acetyltransferase [Bacillota bacterium]